MSTTTQAPASYTSVSLVDALPGDEVWQAGEWTPVEAFHLFGGNVKIVFPNGSTHSMPASHCPTIRRAVVSEAPDLEALGWTISPKEITFSHLAPPEIAGTTATRWEAVREGRALLSGYETRDEIVEAVLAHIDEETLVPVTFADGSVREIAKGVAAMTIGLDSAGNVVVDSEGIVYALTPCHNASATGSMGVTACRVCYEEVDDYFGGPASVATPVAA